VNQLPQRFYSLDVLRGLGALVIVFNHWPNFFYYQGNLNGHQSQLPLYPLLKPLYTNGWRAVDMFFCLSGFVFFWLYSAKIKSRATPAKEFGILRFSRLYPLHLLTLLLVAGGQIIMFRIFGSWFVCGNNDRLHFVSQLFFVSSWWKGSTSFNGPVWSVSIEILLYILFFLVCRFNFIRWWHLLIYVCLGEFWFIHHGSWLMIARGILSFFAGGISYQIFLFLWRRHFSISFYKALAVATLLLWILIPLEAESNHLYAVFQSIFGHEHLHFLGKILLRISQGSYELLLFPLTLVTLASWEARRGTLGRRFAILGDLSYSTYLLHFPLQLLFMLAAFGLGLPAVFFSSPLTMLLFFAVLIPVSLASHNFLERPAQSFLRSKLLRRVPSRSE
jgi:peptidoglycan/LPS O-acetylase OafA/YrhL